MKGIEQYQNVQVMTADGVRLIVMLYDGVIRFNKSAAHCMSVGDVEGRNTFIGKSFNIISELQNSLNMEEGGEVALNLARLYDFSINQLTLANASNDPRSLDAVSRVIGELKEGWEAIVADRVHGEEKKDQKGVNYGT